MTTSVMDEKSTYLTIITHNKGVVSSERRNSMGNEISGGEKGYGGNFTPLDGSL
jgi:hypothetical protein